MKRLAFLLLLLTFTGCTQLMPVQSNLIRLEPEVMTEPEAFGQALDLLTETQSLSALKEFQQRYPGSLWSARAATIILYVEELAQRKLQLEDFRNTQQQLQSENQLLAGKIEQLKILLIELEQRPK